MTSMNEADTRANLIDPKLHAVGWGKLEQAYIHREVICPGRIINATQRSSEVKSDYVLSYQGRKLAVVEAKKESLDASEGIRQAIDYATRLQCRIAYSTNGHQIYQIDTLTGEQAYVDEFLSPQDLWALTFDDTDTEAVVYWRRSFAAVPFETKSGTWKPRYYQENAVYAVLDSLAKGNKRILLTLATGTGKTAIAFHLVWKLFHARWTLNASLCHSATRRPRILFLADRNILADQAFSSFGAFGDGALMRITPELIGKHGVPKNASIFFTIFQTLMGASDEQQADNSEKNYFTDYPSDFFDFIIIDECHRGGANDESSWREILTYFAPAVQLGLTATPKRKDNVDTYDYFGEPVYSYTLKEGIEDGFLTPFKVQMISGIMDEYIYTPGDGVVIQGEPEAGKLYKAGDFNRIITIPAREQARVAYWMRQINPHEKTIVFCASQEHAAMVRDMVNQWAVKQGITQNPAYCVRVTAHDGKEGETDLRQFQNNDRTIPTILTTSRKLSTGVDAPNVRNIVLMRPCNNMIEFKQIVGRGTRLYEGKAFFTIYDFDKAYHNFSDPEWDGEPLPHEEPKPTAEPTETPEPTPAPSTSPQPTEPPPPPKEKIVIQFSDGQARKIQQHLASSLYWFKGSLVTAHTFIQQLYDDLPSLFHNEDELRKIWSLPSTRDALLNKLREAEYTDEKLNEMSQLIGAVDSDVYDLLAYIAFAKETHTRVERVKTAFPDIQQAFSDDAQTEFIQFVLNQYLRDGVGQLSQDNMKGLLELKYGGIDGALQQFGSVNEIKQTFVGFQQYLYQDSVMTEELA